MDYGKISKLCMKAESLRSQIKVVYQFIGSGIVTDQEKAQMEAIALRKEQTKIDNQIKKESNY